MSIFSRKVQTALIIDQQPLLTAAEGAKGLANDPNLAELTC